jgi:hypothetical protein
LHRLKGRAAFYAQNGKGGNERNILEEKKLLPRITEGNVRKTKARAERDFMRSIGEVRLN